MWSEHHHPPSQSEREAVPSLVQKLRTRSLACRFGLREEIALGGIRWIRRSFWGNRHARNDKLGNMGKSGSDDVRNWTVGVRNSTANGNLTDLVSILQAVCLLVAKTRKRHRTHCQTPRKRKGYRWYAPMSCPSAKMCPFMVLSNSALVALVGRSRATSSA